jgi:predicted RNase H-like nuclease (RuvC/YqgF family)
VRYDAVNAMLLNEFLKEHRKVEQQEQQLQEQGGSIRKQRATIEELKEEICRLTEIVKVEASEIQKVNAMLLNEFLKEHRAFVEEERKVEQQQKEIDVLKAELKDQRSLIEKVSASIEVTGPLSKVATRNP